MEDRHRYRLDDIGIGIDDIDTDDIDDRLDIDIDL